MAPSKSIHEYCRVENEKSPMQEKLTPSKGMIKKDDSLYYSSPRQNGEFSRMDEVRRNSDEEVLYKQSILPSSPGKGNLCKTSPGRDVHSKEGMKTFPTGKNFIWSTYPCASHGNSNHNMEKFQRI